MVDQQLAAWRREVSDFFQQARRELQEIIARLDHELTGVETPPGPAIVSGAASERPALAGDASAAANPSDSPPITAAGGADFSQRLDQLKRQLNQRLQDQSQISSDSQPWS